MKTILTNAARHYPPASLRQRRVQEVRLIRAKQYLIAEKKYAVMPGNQFEYVSGGMK